MAIGYATLRDDAFDVTGGTVTSVSRLVPGSNQGWDITVAPDAHADVTVVLPVTTDCAASGAVCTAGGKMLSARVAANDPDVADSVTGYSLSGTDAGLFEITTAGALTFRSAPNFEAPRGGTNDNSNTYTLTVTATDPDAADSIASYALSGTDADLFQITTAGALSFSSAPNYEAPAGGVDDDSNTDELTVTATGGTSGRARTDTQTLTVTVTDVNENPPPPPSPPPGEHPGAPRSFSTSTTTTAYTLSWDPPISGGTADSYEWEWRHSGTGWTSSGSTTGTSVTRQYGGLPVGTRIEFRLKSRNEHGGSSWKEASVTRPG